MALEDVVSTAGYASVAGFANRGNIGTLEDQLGKPDVSYLYIDVPIAAEVQSGVQYGQQGTELTGSYVGGGGGSGYSRSRVVNK